MTTYQSSGFDSKSYSQYRPTYEKPLYDALFKYHQANGGSFGVAVDLGTGTGQVAIELVDRFDKVIGIDKSEVMISNATQHPKIEYKVGDCLQIPIPDQSADLLVIGVAIHWFPIPQFWNEVKRVVKPGGTLGFWGYSTVMAPEYPSLTDAIHEFTANTLGPYWEEGRKRMDVLHQDYLVSLPFRNIQGRIFYPHPRIPLKQQILDLAEPKEGFATNSIPASGFVKKFTTLNELRSFLKTWSGYHNYIKHNPDKKDPVDEIIENAIVGTGLKLDEHLDLVYPQDIILSQV